MIFCIRYVFWFDGRKNSAICCHIPLSPLSIKDKSTSLRRTSDIYTMYIHVDINTTFVSKLWDFDDFLDCSSFFVTLLDNWIASEMMLNRLQTAYTCRINVFFLFANLKEMKKNYHKNVTVISMCNKVQRINSSTLWNRSWFATPQMTYQTKMSNYYRNSLEIYMIRHRSFPYPFQSFLIDHVPNYRHTDG